MIKIYMYVTPDIYELPLAVADSTQELADMLGRNEKSVRSSISKCKKSGWKVGRYRLVKIGRRKKGQ